MEFSTICYCGHQVPSSSDESISPIAPHSASAAATSASNPPTSKNNDDNNNNNPPQHTLTNLLCRACVHRMLSSQISRYQSTLEEHEGKKRECERRLLETRISHPSSHNINNSHESTSVCTTSKSNNSSSDLPAITATTTATALTATTPLPDPNRITSQLQNLKQTLEYLQTQTSSLALRVTAKRMENEERQETLQQCRERVILGRERLERMRRCMLLDSVNSVADSSSSSSDNSKNTGDSMESNEEKKAAEGTLIHEELQEDQRQQRQQQQQQQQQQQHQGGGRGSGVEGGGLRDALVTGTHQIQSLRFQFALKVFDMHRIDVGEQYHSTYSSIPTTTTTTTTDTNALNSTNTNFNNTNKPTNGDSQQRRNTPATGVGKISTLPLPHAGPALYGVLPPMVLASSLRLVASLTSLVARCLGVVLPHPILVGEREEHWCHRGIIGGGGTGDCANNFGGNGGGGNDRRSCVHCGKTMMRNTVIGGGGSSGKHIFGGDVIDFVDEDDDGRDGEDGDIIDEDEYGENNDYVCNECKRGESTASFGSQSMQQPHGAHTNSRASSSSFTTQQKHSTRSSGTRSSLLSFVGSSAKKAIALATGSATSSLTSSHSASLNAHNQRSTNPPRRTSNSQHFPSKSISPAHSTNRSISMSPDSIARRINHASFAVLLENHEEDAAEYILNPPRWKDEGNTHNNASSGNASIKNGNTTNPNDPTHQTTYSGQNIPSRTSSNNQRSSGASTSFNTKEEYLMAEERFSTGLQLLQNDVVALCFRAGVDVSTLWPAESVLLNLYALLCHCRKMVDAKNNDMYGR